MSTNCQSYVICNPCVVCTPKCKQQCNPCNSYNSYNYCDPCNSWNCNPCPKPTPVVVAYITNTATTTAIPSGGTLIPVGTVITTGSTAVPAGTVTVINSFTAAPTTNIGGVTMNNGFFTVPVAGRYSATANNSFDTVSSTDSTDYRSLQIYRVEATSGVVTLVAVDSRTPIVGSATNINLSTEIDLACGDRIFVSALQSNIAAASINTLAYPGRLSLVRIN